MIDILIPLGKGSRHDNLELRYCLRSIEKHLTGVEHIFIVGEKPGWTQNVIYIGCPDNPNNWERARNIYRKIMVGIGWIDTTLGSADWSPIKRLSDNFLFMNDDHFLLTAYTAQSFPYYHRGQIALHDFVSNQPQYHQYQNTIRHRFGSDYYDFDVHCPIVYNRKKFIEVSSELKEWPEYGYAIKTLYANDMIDTTNWVPCEDLKFSEPLMKESIYRALEGRPWFSIGDKCLKSGAMKEVLQELYPNKSKYEV